MPLKEKTKYVFDTNIILNAVNDIFIKDQTIIIPEMVLQELDNNKDGHTDQAFNQREFGRLLQRSTLVKNESIILSEHEEAVLTYLEVNSFELVIFSIKEPKAKKPDDIILETFNYLKDQVLVSNDVLCRYKAISKGIKTYNLGCTSESQELIIQKEIELNEENLQKLSKEVQELIHLDIYNIEGLDASEIDPEYKKDVYCYIIKNGKSSLLQNVVDSKICIIHDEFFNKQAVKPQNQGQRFQMQAMLDLDIDVSVIEAKQGSGKSLLQVQSGIKHIQQGNFDKIVYIRNSVESTDKAEEVGFLSGNEEKFKIYNYPLYDSLEFIQNKTNMKPPQNQAKGDSDIDPRVLQLMKKYNIETMWNGSIRGRTISSQFVIIDEVQNFSKSSLLTVLSRIDEKCKVIMIGSNRQIDHPYITKNTNGLSVILNSLKEVNPEITLHQSKMDKVLRGRITQFQERIFN